MRIRSSARQGDTVPMPRHDGTPRTRDDQDQRLGAILQREGVLSADDIAQIARVQADSGELFGESAVTSGKVTEEQRDLALMLQADRSYLRRGEARLDPLLVAAFDLNDNYVHRIRTIRARILQAQATQDVTDMQTCALLGLDCDEEMAVIAANLAIVMARLGAPTLLVDAALHKPRLHELFRMENRKGLGNMRHDHSVDELIQQTPIDNLWLLPAGPQMPEKGVAFERESLLSRFSEWRIPSTNLLVSLPLRSRNHISTINASLAGFGSVVPVVRKHDTRIGDLRALVDLLDEQGTPVLGTVIV